jgi:hypothetical protein
MDGTGVRAGACRARDCKYSLLEHASGAVADALRNGHRGAPNDGAAGGWRFCPSPRPRHASSCAGSRRAARDACITHDNGVDAASVARAGCAIRSRVPRGCSTTRWMLSRAFAVDVDRRAAALGAAAYRLA